jgi:hypothetical protein
MSLVSHSFLEFARALGFILFLSLTAVSPAPLLAHEETRLLHTTYFRVEMFRG